MNKLILLVGLSSSGKSAYAEAEAKKPNHFLVSTHKIREQLSGTPLDMSRNGEVFQIAYQQIEDHLASYFSTVIFDATNLTVQERKKTLNLAKKHNAKVECHIFATPLYLCLEANSQRQHPLKNHTICAQRAKFQMPQKSEGIDIIAIHYPNKDRESLLDQPIASSLQENANYIAHELNLPLAAAAYLYTKTYCTDSEAAYEALVDNYNLPFQELVDLITLINYRLHRLLPKELAEMAKIVTPFKMYALFANGTLIKTLFSRDQAPAAIEEYLASNKEREDETIIFSIKPSRPKEED